MMVSAEETDSRAIANLAASFMKVAAGEVTITRLTGDASTRSYFRARSGSETIIIVLYGAPFDEREPSVERLARLEAENPAARLTFANDPCAHIEVTRLLRDFGLPVPRILTIAGAERAVLIEDVGDLRLQDWMKTRTDAEVTAAYRKAVELIVRIQEATQWALEAGSICSRLAFDEGKLRWELGFFFANYFNRYRKMRLDSAVANAVQADFKELCAELAARPRVLTHRDYHARNLMMHGGEMFIIDHQDARLGPASYDLASLLSDPYTALPPETCAEMVDLFLEMKAASETGLASLETFQAEFDMMTAQRMLKALGTYASQAAQNNAAYVEYIPPAIERAVAAMDRLGRFHATRELLMRSIDGSK